MLRFQFDGAFEDAPLRATTSRSTFLLVVATAALLSQGGAGTVSAGSPWMTVSVAEPALTYASVASQAACLAAEVEPGTICVERIGEVPVLAQAAIMQH